MYDAQDLVGRKIVKIRPMTQEEMDYGYWTGTPPLVFVLDDGTCFWAMQDAEGNGPGRIMFVRADDSTRIA